MADQKRVLILFTNSYPYGHGYNWLDSEIALFHRHFDEVVISPYSYEGNKRTKEIPRYQNVKVLAPVLEDDIIFTSLWQLRKVFTRRIFFYLKEFIYEKVFASSYWFKIWAQSCLKTEILLRSPIFHLLGKGDDEKILYFYWGNNQTLMVPFLRGLGYNYNKILVRFHGFDLYKERLRGYQPFRRPLLRSVSKVATISAFGATYLKREYPDIAIAATILRLGVKSTGRSQKSNDGWLRIVSCARIIRLKRIELIPRLLRNLPFKIEWTHIGDGEFKYLVEKEIECLPENIRINMPGWLPADVISTYYRNNPVDIFISLSESEGIPVSIMEALAAGIPVFSTDVGGISEIVDEKVGDLINFDIGEQEMGNALIEFIKKYLAAPETYRDQAFERFRELCDKDKCDQLLLEQLRS